MSHSTRVDDLVSRINTILSTYHVWFSANPSDKSLLEASRTTLTDSKDDVVTAVDHSRTSNDDIQMKSGVSFACSNLLPETYSETTGLYGPSVEKLSNGDALNSVEPYIVALETGDTSHFHEWINALWTSVSNMMTAIAVIAIIHSRLSGIFDLLIGFMKNISVVSGPGMETLLGMHGLLAPGSEQEMIWQVFKDTHDAAPLGTPENIVFREAMAILKAGRDTQTPMADLKADLEAIQGVFEVVVP